MSIKKLFFDYVDNNSNELQAMYTSFESILHQNLKIFGSESKTPKSIYKFLTSVSSFRKYVQMIYNRSDITEENMFYFLFYASKNPHLKYAMKDVKGIV